MSALKINFARLPSTIGIVGSRDFPRLKWVEKFVEQLREDSWVVSGGARGVDKTAEVTAKRCGLNTTIYLPNKDLPIPARFFDRNTDIVKHVQQTHGLMVAFLLEPQKTGGTRDTLKKCDRMSVPWVSFHMTEEGTWLEPRVSPIVGQSLKLQEMLFGSPQ